MSIDYFEVRGREGRLVTLEDGAYLNVELHEGYYALAWASDLALDTTLGRIRGLLPQGEPTVIAFDKETGSRTETQTKDLDGILMGSTTVFTFIRIAYDELSITWESPPDTSERGPQSEVRQHGQVGLIAHSYDKNLIRSFLQETGAPMVAEHTAELLDQTAYLAKFV